MQEGAFQDWGVWVESSPFRNFPAFGPIFAKSLQRQDSLPTLPSRAWLGGAYRMSSRRVANGAEVRSRTRNSMPG